MKTIDDIPEPLRKPFLKWIKGQTCQVKDGVKYFYDYDVKKFLRLYSLKAN